MSFDESFRRQFNERNRGELYMRKDGVIVEQATVDGTVVVGIIFTLMAAAGIALVLF